MDDVPGPTQSPGFVGSPEVENAIVEWQSTGIAQVNSISINLNEQQIDLSTNDMRLLHYILKAGQSPESREYTIWTNTFVQYVTNFLDLRLQKAEMTCQLSY